MFQSDCVLYMFIKMHDIYLYSSWQTKYLRISYYLGRMGMFILKYTRCLFKFILIQITKCVSNLLHFNFTLFLYVEIRYFLKILTINFTFILIWVAQSIYYTDHIFFYTFSVHLAFVTDRKYTVVSPLVASIGTDSVFRNSMTLS